MIIYIDLRDRVKLRAKHNRIAKSVKSGLKIALYGYVATRVIMGGVDSIVAYGKATAVYKGIDILAAKVFS